jgi:hypothetical protein
LNTSNGATAILERFDPIERLLPRNLDIVFFVGQGGIYAKGYRVFRDWITAKKSNFEIEPEVVFNYFFTHWEFDSLLNKLFGPY